jgi:hypothetical protein
VNPPNPPFGTPLPNAVYNRLKTTGECGTLQQFVQLDFLKKYARCTREIASRNAMAKAEFSKNIDSLASKLDLNLSKKLVACYIWSVAFCGAETCIFR